MRTLLLLACPLVVVAAVAPSARAWNPSGPLPGHSQHGEGFSEGPRRRLPLIAGCGDVHLPVTTSSPEAQHYFDQGLGQLHGFWYWEAERSFRTVLQLDPDCVMAHWGLAMANLENESRAKEFLARATGPALEKATPREKAWIEAARTLFGLAKDAAQKDAAPAAAAKKPAGKDATQPKDGAKEDAAAKNTAKKDDAKKDDAKAAARLAFMGALETIALDHPDDVEPRALLVGFSWINRDRGVPISSRLAVDALGREVLARNPRHPVHHYLIHLWDKERPAAALASAAACGPAAPGVAHMWHMPGHVYSKLERWHDAVWQQEAAARVDHAQMIRAHVYPDQIHNFAHNSEWMIRNLNHLGRARDAVAVARNMIAMPRIARSKEVKPDPEQSFKEEGSCWQFGRDRLCETILRWELWDVAAALADTPFLEPGQEFDDRWRREHLLALAGFGRGDAAAGRAALARLEALEAEARDGRRIAAEEAEAKARGEDKTPADISKAMAEAMRPCSERVEALRGPLAELRLRDALAAGRMDDARAALAALSDKARQGIDAARLAVIHLALGDTEKALDVATKIAADAKRELYPQALLAHVQWEAGRRDEALATFAEVRSLAAAADPDLPVLTRLAPLAEAAGVTGNWRLPAAPAADIGERPDLDTLGPLRWQAWQAGAWKATAPTGERVSAGAYAGRPHIILLTLGMACAHCNEQVRAFAAAAERFEKAGLPVIVISTDPPEDVATAAAGLPAASAMTALSGADGEAFRALDAWDDFENTPLHATCYVSADGRMRWQHAGYEPFMLPDFLLDEIRRLEATAGN
jgi:peroxiredoxin